MGTIIRLGLLTSLLEIYIDAGTKRSYTWSQVKNTAIEFGRGLRSQWGFKKGDVLGFFSPNSVDYAPVFFGVHYAGGTASTANPTYTVKELAFQMKDSGVKGIVTQLPVLPVVREAARTIGLPEDRIILLGDGRDPSGTFKHFTEIKPTGLLGALNQGPTRVDPKKGHCVSSVLIRHDRVAQGRPADTFQHCFQHCSIGPC